DVARGASHEDYRNAEQPGALACDCLHRFDLPSKPDTNTGHEPRIVDILELGAALIRRAPVGAFPDHPDIGSELTMELVAQAETGLDRAQATANSCGRVILLPRFSLDQPLADQAVGEQHFVLGFRPESDLTRLAHIRCGFDFELVRCKTD